MKERTEGDYTRTICAWGGVKNSPQSEAQATTGKGWWVDLPRRPLASHPVGGGAWTGGPRAYGYLG